LTDTAGFAASASAATCVPETRFNAAWTWLIRFAISPLGTELLPR
jgi:hypothetical protein